MEAPMIRRALVHAGHYLPDVLVRRAENLIRDIELRRWLHANGMTPQRLVDRREELFQLVGKEVGSQPVLYLEFGVAEGAAMRQWSRLLTHPESVLCGFDSFGCSGASTGTV
jgi:hypothetical protein